MRVALVHDWLTGMRGGEKCLELLCRLWPDAHLHTLIHRHGHLSPTIERMDIRTSFLQHIPGIFENYRYSLPLMPMAIERFRLTGYDLVISLSHCVAKSVRVPRGVPHVCYCFTPMRYAWHMREAYFARECGVRSVECGTRQQQTPRSPLRTGHSLIRNLLLADLRRWDRNTARRVTHFVAISRTVEQRIHECYGRESQVIFPPVDVDFYTPAPVAREEYYLCVSALSPYKRVDLAIEACQRLGKRLVVIGTGPEALRLRDVAGPSVSFLGWQTDESIREHYRRCRGLLFPGVEDFGIVPLEAQACGAPVIGLAAGGAAETVIPAMPTQPGTGILFANQTSEALSESIFKLESGSLQFSPAIARANAENYSKDRFTSEIQALVRGLMSDGKADAKTFPATRAAA